MKYFEILKDSRIFYKYEIQEVEWQEIEGQNIGTGYFKGKENDMPDFINYKKEFLVSLELKNVLEMYTYDVKFNLITFNNMEAKIQKEYYSVEAPLVEGLGESTIYNKDNTVKERVLSHKKLQNYSVFRLKELEPTQFSRPHIFVHLDIVESALRRGVWGMNFDEMVVED
ncbi:hypothetical protein [Clostridium saccharobutylicum]|uniref:Uncharacterized protein n=1 Tax=Clostridium saccharobutylicum DSM 13864 TaxID=1345695 RepID=U5MV03_CLOSA|nr:hypothetical protein [Clostridium saccharobutylicum]AGX44624.1 hypothetical protein CLSA_c36630 [Clostridium saccharobutylicum DSM 13864]AQR91914.1 hypothetical protein CLOSC_36420 [Clostridium saccharobutylicum]AQS01816.1 hypothetical protein CSACC_36470 [Clostridium saccharobutylicum]AQS15799.1 hypothetical protein CLOSACC_36470 [Clostridium saccharobutylicum]MBA2903401.1 hypothetical protein [Clostridium saccharobutylicum]